jgi:hypothetical protein
LSVADFFMDEQWADSIPEAENEEVESTEISTLRIVELSTMMTSTDSSVPDTDDVRCLSWIDRRFGSAVSSAGSQLDCVSLDCDALVGEPCALKMATRTRNR